MRLLRRRKPQPLRHTFLYRDDALVEQVLEILLRGLWTREVETEITAEGGLTVPLAKGVVEPSLGLSIRRRKLLEKVRSGNVDFLDLERELWERPRLLRDWTAPTSWGPLSRDVGDNHFVKARLELSVPVFVKYAHDPQALELLQLDSLEEEADHVMDHGSAYTRSATESLAQALAGTSVIPIYGEVSRPARERWVLLLAQSAIHETSRAIAEHLRAFDRHEATALVLAPTRAPHGYRAPLLELANEGLPLSGDGLGEDELKNHLATLTGSALQDSQRDEPRSRVVLPLAIYY